MACGVIKDPAFLDGLKTRHLHHGFTSSLLLGFFYQDSAEAPEYLSQHHFDKTRCMAPSFTPTSELLPVTGRKEGYNSARPLSLSTFIQGIGSSLNFYEPVASQDSFLVLCRHSKDSEGHCRADKVRVCNPLTGEVLDGRMTQSFQLVAIWVKGKRFIYIYYCSKTRSWWPASFPELMAGLYLVSTPAAASHGKIHWLCGCWKSWSLSHVVSLHVDGEELSYLELPSEVKRNKTPLLGNSADGGLLLLLMKGLHMSLWKHKRNSADGSFLLLLLKGAQMSLWKHGSNTSSWVLSETINLASSLPRRVLQMHAREKIKLEMFLGKSGAVVLWVDGEGLFLFSLSDGSIRKIGNKRATKKHSLCPYEIDWVSCLSMMNLIVDDSLLLDAGRKIIQKRWRKMVARHMKKNKKHLDGEA
ncbi:hypothetical protein PAHAL_9G033100 [Panicum hallii]|uniref:DUF7595 domain-containing protein n=1 Tax=Panicum hallii TaxID=206008 RepID=A0A2T8I006_9POAL|nr:hypothetical protein PAHAL_9G033100 [Panicum hallii]